MARRDELFFEAISRARASRGVALMGVCNVTPDSFSDGGKYFSFEAARARVDALVTEGADIIDVGGESTRPGAPPVAPKEQLARVLEVVRYAAKLAPARTVVSIDTTSAEVAAACLDAGAVAVNDVSCLRDESLAKAAASHGAALVLMHARGTQAEMRGFSDYADDAYGDVVRDVIAEWRAATDRAVALGVRRDALMMDPGLGFAKNARQSEELLRRTADIVRALDVPVLVGASRKSFLKVVDDAPPAERTGASIAAAIFAAHAGAAALRVHDVRATRQAIDLTRRLTQPRATRKEA